MSSSLDLDQLENSPYIAGLEFHAEIDSTQTRARALASGLATDRLPYLVLADRQTAGRGRGDNRWWTGAGSLAFSLIFAPENFGLSRPARPSRSLVVGVALVDVVAPLLAARFGAANPKVGLHWPNDVFVGEQKLAGILIDVAPDERHVLGVGVNTNNTLAAAPAEVRARATSLVELLDEPIDATTFLLDFFDRLGTLLRLSENDPAAMGGRFQELCLQVGQELTVVAPGSQRQGRCQGVAPDGALLLRTAEGVERVYSGALRHS